MLFDDLLKMDLPETLSGAIHRLLEVKVQTQEKELHPQMPEILDFIRDEIGRQKQMADDMEDDRRAEWEPLNTLFYHCLTKV